VSVSDKRIWTFIVQDGEKIKVQPKGNLPDIHEGGLSVFKFVLTDEQAEETTALLEKHGCSVKATTERQTEDQAAERSRLAGAFQDSSVFPCARCPECAWFDPTQVESYCGAESWPRESASSLLEHISKAREDLNLCPLEKGKAYL